MPGQLYPPTWQRLTWFLALGMGVVCLIGAAVDGDGWTRPAAVLGATVTLAAATRSVFLRVDVHSDHVVLVNWLQTVRLPWPG
ncbi:hypothetical protein [Micromonospora sp. LOL_021]|uniref:hypothetical protein n=1 Tax=Micromonospora sp. LOL_021 TaxID=3345417 RepID=UPI003A8A28ED